MHTSQADGRTDRQRYHANSRLYKTQRRRRKHKKM